MFPARAETLPRGARVGSFRIGELRREGGFALLYDAFDDAGQRVAVKVLRRELAFHGNAALRFHREVAALSELSHPNVVRVIEHGDLADGRPFVVMEWLDGGDLQSRLARSGALALDEALALLSPLADALHNAHARGIVHRDVKAENVVLRGDGTPVLVDFGIAHVASDFGGQGLTSQSVLGSPSSMAPEQILGRRVDARTDVYGLGVLLFQIVTGVLPFRSPDALELEEMHLRATPPAPSALAPVPPALDALVARCLAKEPSDRPATARAFVEALRGIASGAPSCVAGVQVEAHVDDVDDPGDLALDEVDEVLARARKALEAEGLRVLREHAFAVLAAGSMEDGRSLVAVATRVADAVEGRVCRSSHVQITVVAHLARGEEALRRSGSWAAGAPGVWVTAPALSGDPASTGEPRRLR